MVSWFKKIVTDHYIGITEYYKIVTESYDKEMMND